MSEIKPALTAEEWAEKFVARSDSWRNEVSVVGDLLEVCTDYGFRSEGRHALAALALHGQPFGFTWEDVDLLHACADVAPFDWPEVRGVADRIAALLAPREEATIRTEVEARAIADAAIADLAQHPLDPPHEEHP